LVGYYCFISYNTNIINQLNNKRMKKLILSLAVLISTVSFSQVITITATECEMHIKAGNVSYATALTSPEVIIEPRSTNTTYILNFQDSTAKFFHYDRVLSVAKIIDIKQSKSKIEVTMLDSTNLGTKIYTYIIIDQIYDQIYYYWYNTISDVTKVETKTKFTLDIQ